MLVEYTTNQAKHKAYALSRELGRNAFHLLIELTPKQLQTRRSMEPDVTAPWSKGYPAGLGVAAYGTPTGGFPDNA